MQQVFQNAYRGNIWGFPAPVKAIDEKCLHTGGIYADKRLALWRLADIAA